MAFKLNLADVKVNDFEALPPGWYNVRVTGVEEKVSGDNAKHPGSTYLNIEYTVQDGEFEDRKVWGNASLLPHALFTIKGLLAAIGGFDVDGELEFDEDDLIGKACMVKLTKREYPQGSGEYTNDIKSFKPEGAVKAGATGSASSGGAANSMLP